MKENWLLKFIVLSTTLLTSLPSLALPLSYGDRLEVSIPNEKYFVGVYEVNQDGNIEIPYLGDLAVLGLEPVEIEAKLFRALIEKGFFLPKQLQLSVEILKWAPVHVTVAGEVFQPGRVLINEPRNELERSISVGTQQVKGNYPIERYLTHAIRAAGGVLPSADVTRVRLIRNDRETVVDLSGVFAGTPVEDVPLIAGDRVEVLPSVRFQPELVRPSQITPPGIKVFVSNLIVPAANNASAGITNREEGISFPYGTRFSHAVISSNCAGGTRVNKNRRAILVRTNRLSGETIAFERPVEDLIRNSQNNEENPLLMPKDSLACYDSSVTNLRDIFRTILDVLNPLDPILMLREVFN